MTDFFFFFYQCLCCELNVGRTCQCGCSAVSDSASWRPAHPFCLFCFFYLFLNMLILTLSLYISQDMKSLFKAIFPFLLWGVSRFLLLFHFALSLLCFVFFSHPLSPLFAILAYLKAHAVGVLWVIYRDGIAQQPALELSISKWLNQSGYADTNPLHLWAHWVEFVFHSRHPFVRDMWASPSKGNDAGRMKDIFIGEDDSATQVCLGANDPNSLFI